MLMAVLVALVLAFGPHPVAGAMLAVGYVSPPGFLVLAGGWAAFHGARRTHARRQLPRAEADFLRGMAAEIEAGASIRQAVIAAADRAPDLDLGPVVRTAVTGRQADEVSQRLGSALPINGRLASAAYLMVAETGASASAAFSGLAVRAADAGDLERERRVLTTQARVSAWVVGGVPVGVTLALMLVGRGPSLHGPAGTMTVLGFGLICAGSVVVWLMVRNQ